jgi:SPP1 family phage portal protein
MYPMEPTETEKINRHIKEHSTVTNEWLIKHFIDNHDTSDLQVGVRYYENENDILNRKMHRYENGTKVVDETKVNNRIPHGWHKLLVDQKTSYLVGNPINFSAEDTLLKFINEYLGEKFDDIANELVKNASNKGVEWLHPYIDENGEFDFIITPAEQIIPIYEGSKQKVLQYVIRYYPIQINGKDTIKVEFWDESQVWFYVRENGEYVPDPFEEVNPQSHFYFGLPGQEQGYGWGKVPFIPFKNNEEMKGDIHYYKELIDAYDLTVSDNQNSLEEIQELIYVLKGYEGTSLSEFMTNLRFYKAITVDENGGVETKTAEVPIDSADKHLDRLRESIFMFGQGVDVGSDKFGNSPSGIALKFLYSLLDLKSNILERKFRQGIQELMWFLCEYLSISGKGEFNYKDIDFTFRRSMMVNDLEQAQIASQSKGIISDETILANHPWVNDLEEEKRRIEEEQSAYQGFLTELDANKVNANEPE